MRVVPSGDWTCAEEITFASPNVKTPMSTGKANFIHDLDHTIPPGKTAQAAIIIRGYSSGVENTTGATKALRIPPKTPPIEMQRKYSGSLFTAGLARAKC